MVTTPTMGRIAAFLGIALGALSLGTLPASAPAVAEGVTDLRAGPAGRIAFRSLASDGKVIWGELKLPESSKATLPAMVVHHGSAGPSPEREGRYANRMVELGIAAFVIDSFGPRGTGTTVDNQARVSGRTMVGDAFAALKTLAAHPRIDRRRIGIVGFSKGGTVALNAVGAQFVRTYLGGTELRFAAHIAFYPWCGLQFRTIRGTGAPLLMLIGGADDYTGVRHCRRYVERMRTAGMNARLVVYPGAPHAFDHGRVTRRMVLRGAQNFSGCYALRADDLWVIDPKTNQRMGSLTHVRDYFLACMTRGATVGPDATAARRAMADATRFARTQLLGAGTATGSRK